MVTYKVLVTKHSDTRYSARPLAWPAVYEEGESERAVLDKLQARLILLHAQSRIVDLDVPVPDEPLDNPWLRFAGIWEHDEDWEAFQAAVEEFRREANAVDIAE